MKWLTVLAGLLLLTAGCGAAQAQPTPEPTGAVVVLHQSDPEAPGGNYTSIDTGAPKEIHSDRMTLFDVTSQLPQGYVSAFAVPGDRGTLLFLEAGEDHSRSWALVAQDPFPQLVELTAALGLAENNGWYSRTAGLPMDFGGRIRIRYADGQTIQIADNQTPVLSQEAGERITALFAQLMAGERVALPQVQDLAEIHFEELRDNGGFTRVKLTILPDGTASRERSSKYDDPTVYEKSDQMDAQEVAALRESMETTGLLAWSGLPDNGFHLGGEKTLTFLFSDGAQVEVKDDRLLPSQISGGFFQVELALTH